MTEIPVSPRSTLCFLFRELDFFKDLDLPELVLHSCLDWSFEMLRELDLTEFLVGSLLLLLLLFLDDPLPQLPPLRIDEFFDCHSRGGKESIVSSNPRDWSPYQLFYFVKSITLSSLIIFHFFNQASYDFSLTFGFNRASFVM